MYAWLVLEGAWPALADVLAEAEVDPERRLGATRCCLEVGVSEGVLRLAVCVFVLLYLLSFSIYLSLIKFLSENDYSRTSHAVGHLRGWIEYGWFFISPS